MSWYRRHHAESLLGALLLAQFLLLGFQVRQTGPRSRRLGQAWAMAALTPLEKGATAALDGCGRVWRSYLWLHGVRNQNRRLRARLARLRLANHQIQWAVKENADLLALLRFRPQYAQAMIAARVIGAGYAARRQIIYLNRGRDAGVRLNQPVVTPQGVVGKISQVTPMTAQVLLLTNPLAGIGAMSADGHLLGVLTGAGAGQCRWRWISNQSPVRVGTELVTSGNDQIFPPSLVLGQVAATHAGAMFQHIQVRPAVRLNDLRQVLVITRIGAYAATPVPAAALAQLPLPHLPKTPLGPLHGPPMPIYQWLPLWLQARQLAGRHAPASPTSAPPTTVARITPPSATSKPPASSTPLLSAPATLKPAVLPVPAHHPVAMAPSSPAPGLVRVNHTLAGNATGKSSSAAPKTQAESPQPPH